jgi:hypothetical protein
MIRAAAKRADIEAGPQPARSTPMDAPRHADVSAAATGDGMPLDPNRNAMRQWQREQGYEPESVMSVLREAVAEKRLGRRSGWQ